MKNENFLSAKDTFAIYTSPVICLVCPERFVNLFLKFILDITVVPRETEDNAYAKLWRDRQRASLCAVVFSVVVNFKSKSK